MMFLFSVAQNFFVPVVRTTRLFLMLRDDHMQTLYLYTWTGILSQQSEWMIKRTLQSNVNSSI